MWRVCCLPVRCSLVPAAAARSLRATTAASLIPAVACCCRKFAACCSVLTACSLLLTVDARCCSLLPAAAARCCSLLLKSPVRHERGSGAEALARYPCATLRSTYMKVCLVRYP